MAVRQVEEGAILRRRGGVRPALSCLVRFWVEPREGEDQPSPFRGYSRDLKTGEERYFRDPRKLVEHILRRLVVEQERMALADEADDLEAKTQ